MLLHPFSRGVELELASVCPHVGCKPGNVPEASRSHGLLTVRFYDQKSLGLGSVCPDRSVRDGVFVSRKVAECCEAVVELGNHWMREPRFALSPVGRDGERKCGELGRNSEVHLFECL